MNSIPQAPVAKSVKTSSLSQQATVEREVQVLELEPQLCAFRMVHRVNFSAPDCPETLTSRYRESVQEGLATPGALKKYLSGKTPALKTLGNLTLAPAGFVRKVQSDGYVAACEQYGSQMSEDGMFEKFRSGQACAQDLVKLDHSTHMLFDRKGGVLPTAIFFDYMNGNLRNGAYHLDKVLDVLSRDSRVKPAPEHRSGRRQGSAAPESLRIDEVPYYNASRGCTQHVEFLFSPTTDDMLRLWAQMKSYGGSYPSTTAHRAVFDLDLLGLREGGAAKHREYWETDDNHASATHLDEDDD